MIFPRSIGYAIASVLKWTSVLLFTLWGGALLALAVYDLREYEPRRAEIDAMLNAAGPLERSPPPLLAELQRANSKGYVASLATRHILGDLDRESPRMRTLARMRRELMWIPLVKGHLSEDEQLLIDRSHVFLGQRTCGFEAGALAVYGRPLNRLSDLELAELVVIARWPTRFRNPQNSADLAKAASALLEQVRTAR